MIRAHRLYFNSIAPVWEFRVAPVPDLRQRLIEFGVRRGEQVLDLGAGTGRLSRSLADLVGCEGRTVALDISERMLIEARRRCGGEFALLCGDACLLPLASASFDRVLCFSTFPHIHAPQRCLAEIHRVLRPGGRVLIWHTCCSRKLNRFHSELNPVVCRDRLPRAADLADELRRAGFAPVRAIERPDRYWVEGVVPFAVT